MPEPGRSWPLGDPEVHQAHRIAENLDVFGFEFTGEQFTGEQLTGEQLAAIDALDTGKRGGPEPEAVTLETFGRPIPEA